MIRPNLVLIHTKTKPLFKNIYQKWVGGGDWGSPLPWNYSAPGTLLEPSCNYTVSVLCFDGFIR